MMLEQKTQLETWELRHLVSSSRGTPQSNGFTWTVRAIFCLMKWCTNLNVGTLQTMGLESVVQRLFVSSWGGTQQSSTLTSSVRTKILMNWIVDKKQRQHEWNFTDNAIGDMGAQAFGELLERNTTIQHISLSSQTNLIIEMVWVKWKSWTRVELDRLWNRRSGCRCVEPSPSEEQHPDLSRLERFVLMKNKMCRSIASHQWPSFLMNR